MNPKENPVRLMDILQIWGTKAQFESSVDSIITPEDRKLFGPQARDLVVQSIIFPAVFARYPATFDGPAYAAVVDGIVGDLGLEKLDPDRINRLMWISIDNGVMEMNTDGRFYVPTEVYDKLRPILEQYE